jgi:hypothetical protein
MAPSSDENACEPKDPPDETMIDDDATVMAETPSTKTDFFEEEMMDLKVRYEIPYRNGKSHGDEFKLHVQLLEAMTTLFDKNILRIYDNKNERVKNMSAKKWSNKEYYKDHFNIHEEPSQRKTVIIHRIMSKKSISDIKHEPSVIQLLKKSSTYLRAHFWKEDEVSLKDIGFLVNYAPTKHSKEFVAKDIFERCSESPDVEWAHAPQFQLIHGQPRIKLAGKKNPVKTHAFSVQVLTKNASMMNKFLQKIYEDDHFYVPYSMKKQFPKAVATAILQQNKLLKDTWVIVVVGIHRAVMSHIENDILESSGVTAISDTNRTDKSGKWNIIVKESEFKTIRKRLAANVHTWVLALPVEVQANTPDSFPPPKVHQKNGYDDEDDDESSYGQASYMSSCAQSYASFDDNDDDEQFLSPPGTKYTSSGLSYASALAGYQAPPTDTRMEVLVPSKATPRESQQILASIQDAVKIANLEAEIISLKTLLIGATTPSTVTETSTPDISSTNERMSMLETNMETMTKQFTTWMQEMRKNDHGYGSQNHIDRPAHQAPEISQQGNQKNVRPAETTPTSHQSKRTDTRTTPDRQDLMHTESDEMQIELFPETNNTEATTLPPLMTQPSFHPTTPPRDHEAIRPTTPATPDSPNMAAMLAAYDLAHPVYPEGYDTDDPMYVYKDNGNGGLFCVGLAQPTDFNSDGTIRGPQPTADQSESITRIFYSSPPRTTDPSSTPIPRTPSPVDTLATQDETEATSNTSSPQGRSSPTPQERLPVTTSPESLLAEGAQTVNE